MRAENETGPVHTAEGSGCGVRIVATQASGFTRMDELSCGGRELSRKHGRRVNNSVMRTSGCYSPYERCGLHELDILARAGLLMRGDNSLSCESGTSKD